MTKRLMTKRQYEENQLRIQRSKTYHKVEKKGIHVCHIF